MQTLQITDYTVTTALGAGRQANWNQLQGEHTGLRRCEFFDAHDLPGYVGQVDVLDDIRVEAELHAFDCRNNRLAWLALEQDGFRESVNLAIDRYGSNRIATFIGTSTSGIHQTELAYLARAGKEAPLPDNYHYLTTHNVNAITEYVRRTLGLTGISHAVSTACSSSAKVFASAERAIRAGLCDAAVVGGVDTLCLTTLYGFHSLQLVAADICRPCDKQRAGLSIGEGAGFALLERAEDSKQPWLLGYGESSDAYHMSSPHPEGDGAAVSMRQALAVAKLKSDAVDYINLHGTGTKANDLAESKAINRVVGETVPCSSTKGWTGHTLGAAGIVEAVYSLLCLEHGWMPPSLNLMEKDSDIAINVLTGSETGQLTTVLSNSFGFGGSNCSLLLGAAR